ncbi:hypothetical protein SUGI_0990750 [Cryptomeria japonica]|nr:hypothetical protein SUGI_0990750 [Cryptomeria japonica]
MLLHEKIYISNQITAFESKALNAKPANTNYSVECICNTENETSIFYLSSGKQIQILHLFSGKQRDTSTYSVGLQVGGLYRELSVIAIRNFAGILDAASDGSWSLRNSKGQFEKIPNLVEETRIQAAILESYLERRGVILPAGYLSCKVILANSDCRALPSVTLHQEVLSYDKWMQLKEESRGGFREWLRHMFSRVERDVSDKIDKKLRFILSTSPAWDRLELKGSQQIYGEFLGFKGKKEDVDALKVVKRSKVAKIVKYKPIMFDLLSGGSTVHLFCIPRDYRNEGTSEVERTEVSVRAGTEVVFQPMDAKKAQQFKVKKIACLSLSP